MHMESTLGFRAHGAPSGRIIARSVRYLMRLGDYSRKLGPGVGLRWYLARALARSPLSSPARLVIKPPDLLHPLTVRMSPCSDEYVFDQIFVRQEYAPVCEYLDDPRFILDLGANVGFASAYFASRYPSARILAVEPDPENVELCRENLMPYGDRIKVLQGAVWPYPAWLTLSYEAGDGWATQVKPADSEMNASVEGRDVATLLDVAGVETADLLKVDIEGSEAEVFASHTESWLPRVRHICIELHNPTCREVFRRALREFDYQETETGEFTMCLNLRARVPNYRHGPAPARAQD